jgi:hypothetical protein
MISRRVRRNDINPLETIQSIDSALEAGHPAMVLYNASVLTDGSQLESLSRERGHASLIVGRSYNTTTQQCEYILRNSWGGTSCNATYDAYHFRCDDQGNLYIPRRDVLLSAYGVDIPDHRPPHPLQEVEDGQESRQ